MISVDSPLTRTSGSNMIFSCDRIIDAERGSDLAAFFVRLVKTP